jgi:hypothetical protein
MPTIFKSLNRFQINYFRRPQSIASRTKVWFVLLCFILAFSPFLVGIFFSCLSVITIMIL